MLHYNIKINLYIPVQSSSSPKLGVHKLILEFDLPQVPSICLPLVEKKKKSIIGIPKPQIQNQNLEEIPAPRIRYNLQIKRLLL